VATLYALIKTKWKYLWIIIITACAFDHMIWTGLAPYFWLILGITTAPNNIDNDYIFKTLDTGRILK
jgi:hypothetical protein